jgi:diaminohydroxyphosphoribosylaminopyrimidine deaminase/5-amino-6-(5-phosphoribosylamino)uracil reductase
MCELGRRVSGLTDDTGRPADVTDAAAMARALELGWRGWGRVHPNPLVGAVVLDPAGAVVGEGWHAEFGGLHAERAALDAAGSHARGGTLVVSLEPCNHHGKQPACTQAVLAAGIARVVYALDDPNPEAAGGAELLRAAGIVVESGCLRSEAAAQNAPFLGRWRAPDRPWVALKLVTSLDGRIADRFGRSRWISGEPARDFVHWLRAGVDAIGVGGATARADDPSLTVRGAVAPRVEPLRVVFDRAGNLHTTLELLRTARERPTCVVAGPLLSGERAAALEAAGARLIRATGLQDGMAALRRMGIASLIVEGGGRLAGALLGEGLVDRFYWIQSPVWLGESGVPVVAGLPGVELATAERWTVVERRALGADTLLVVERG